MWIRGVIIVDSLSTVKSILDTDWTSANTDSLTPTVTIIYEAKQVSLANADHILLYEVDEDHAPDGIGGKDYHEEPIVAIDIRTTFLRAAIGDIRPHLIKMKDEVLRIIRVNVENPDSDYKDIFMIRKRDKSDKTIGMGRIIFDAQLDRWVSL